MATSYDNIGSVCHNKGEYDKALEWYQKCLDIELKTLGAEHPDVASSYNNIGSVWENKGEYDKALEWYQKSLDIRLKTLGAEHPDVATLYFNIGTCHQNLHTFDLAIEALIMGYRINRKGGYPFRIAYCFEKLNNLNEAFLYFMQSAEIRIADSEAGPNHERTKESIQNTIRVAKIIGKENELPEWIRKNNK